MDSGWTFTVTSYLWMAGLDGDVGLFGREPVPIDQKFGDILGDLEFAGTVVAELHNGSWGVVADVMYVKTSADSEITRTIGGVPVELDAGVDTESFTATLMGEYRVLSNGRATVDLMAGARIWSVDNDISAKLAAGGATVADFSGPDGDTWVDAIVGAKTRVNLDAKWYVNGWGMIGGGGSDLTWDVLAGIGYQWTDRFSTSLGYRALGVDYEEDGFVYDVVQHGPVLGCNNLGAVHHGSIRHRDYSWRYSAGQIGASVKLAIRQLRPLCWWKLRLRRAPVAQSETSDQTISQPPCTGDGHPESGFQQRRYLGHFCWRACPAASFAL